MLIIKVNLDRGPMFSYRIPAELNGEIDELEDLIQKNLSGIITDVELKMHRVPFGIYEQRTRGTFMVRIRSTAGIVTPVQLRKIAELAKKYGSGILHITTRQELQIHDVKIENLTIILRELLTVGLSTRGGGGNTVRNITASWDSGISRDEIFDVTPHAVALTSRLIATSDSWVLPRKYKIAFSNSIKDSALATINDLGFIATIQNGNSGFKVYVAGGLGRSPQVGYVLHDFIAESEVYLVAEAIKRLFSKYGNRKNKHAARLRFLWNSLGAENFIDLYRQEKNALIAENDEPFTIPEIVYDIRHPLEYVPISVGKDKFSLWKKRYSQEQRQNGLYVITVPLVNGILTAEKADFLGRSLEPFGEDALRFTLDQNVTIRNISEGHLSTILSVVQQVTDLWDQSPILGTMVACAGASTCQLGICLARGALISTVNTLRDSNEELDSLKDFKIKISGCSNTCGQHMAADLGFFGKVGKRDQRSYPAYSIVAGASIHGDGSKLSEKIDEISARDLPSFIAEFLISYKADQFTFDSFSAYIAAKGQAVIQSICDKYRTIPTFTEDQSYYQDWGAENNFTVAGRGTGECAAGLFDMIEFDLKQIEELHVEFAQNKSAAILYKMCLYSSRMLLITRGIEAHSDENVFDLFIDQFVKTGLIESKFLPLLSQAKIKDNDALLNNEAIIFELTDAVKKLYSTMDNSLQFRRSL